MQNADMRMKRENGIKHRSGCMTTPSEGTTMPTKHMSDSASVLGHPHETQIAKTAKSAGCMNIQQSTERIATRIMDMQGIRNSKHSSVRTSV